MKQTTEEKLKAQLVIVTGLCILFLIFKLKGLLYAAALTGFTSLAIPKAGDLIVYVWFKIAEILGWINSRILLSLIFFLILFPVALVSRLFSRDSLLIKGRNKKTIYAIRNHKFTKNDLENTW